MLRAVHDVAPAFRRTVGRGSGSRLSQQLRRWAHTGRHRVTIRDPMPPVLPKTVRDEEAEKMGRLDYTPGALEPRSKANSPKEFKDLRREYQKQVSALRKQFATEWAERREREQAVIADLEAQRELQRRRQRQERDIVKAHRLRQQEKRVAMHRKAREARREVSRRNVSLWLERVDHSRQEWLDKLEADSQHWVTEDSIDEAINEDLFTMKYPWQYEDWFTARARRMVAQESRRRSSGPAQAETAEEALAQLESAAQEAGVDDSGVGLGFESTWESEGADSELEYFRDTFDPVATVERTGIQVEELVFQMPQSKVRELQGKHYMDYAERYLGDDWRWLRRKDTGELIVDEGLNDQEEGEILAADRAGFDHLLSRALARRRDRLMRHFPHVLEARAEKGLDLEQGVPVQELELRDGGDERGEDPFGMLGRSTGRDDEVTSARVAALVSDSAQRTKTKRAKEESGTSPSSEEILELMRGDQDKDEGEGGGEGGEGGEGDDREK